MFENIGESKKKISIFLDGELLEVESNQVVAAALWSSGHTVFHSSQYSHQPRAPFCMIGVCFECLVEIDGVKNQQSCLIQVSDGMKINRQLKSPANIQPKSLNSHD